MKSIPVLQPQLPAEIHKGAWAKFDRLTGEYLPLTRHLDDAAFTSALLWEHWLPPHSKQIIASNLGNDLGLAKKLAVFLTAGHDIGKHSSPFAQKAEPLKRRMEELGCVFLQLTPEEQRSAPHSIFSWESLDRWFSLRSTAPLLKGVESLATVVAGHHGTFPERAQIKNRVISRERRLHWGDDRIHYWDRAAKTVGFTESDIEALSTTILSAPAQMILCGFVVMADWISSNTDFFPLVDDRDSEQRAEEAFSRLNFPPHWSAQAPGTDEELFQSSFSLPAEASPRPVQKTAMECARSVEDPSLMIIEAPTGEGKTEAALTAAEIIASKFSLSGVVVALPTCATSDAMFPRFLSWLDHRLPEDLSAGTVLSHGKAQFNDEYRSLFSNIEGDFSAIYDDRNFTPHWWFTGRKTSSLADFSVGTIDQVLFAALRSKHLVLRHLGLSNKVLILDEIHSADAYMLVYLRRLLEWLGAMGVPVIALSATLAPQRRAELLQAYKAGALVRTSQKYAVAERKRDEELAYAQESYPLISSVSDKEPQFRELEPSSRSSEFAVSYIGEDLDSLISEIALQSEDGGCIGVVCNTVNRAQKVFTALRAECAEDTELVLLHSRFLGFERRRLEKDLVARLGPKSTVRPKKLIVVSTQIIEQSMDIDFDLMFTDIAPIDLLFQRAGRLHRHSRAVDARPVGHRKPRLIISGCSKPVATEPPLLDKGICAVYGSSVLYRTLYTLLEHGSILRSPKDVSALVRRAYEEENSCPAAWKDVCERADEQARTEAEGQEERAKTFLEPKPAYRAVWLRSKGGVLEAREETRGQAQVRDIEDSLEVILVQKEPDGFSVLDFSPEYPGEPIHFGHQMDEDLSRALAKSVVSLPFWTLKGKLGDLLLDELELNVLGGEEIEVLNRNRWLRGQLFLPLGKDLRAEIAGLNIEYSQEMGLNVWKN